MPSSTEPDKAPKPDRAQAQEAGSTDVVAAALPLPVVTPGHPPAPEHSPSLWVADAAGARRSLWELGWSGTVVVLAIACVLSIVAIGQIGTVAGTLAGEHATAVVTAYREQRSRDGSTTWFPVFRFATASDEVVEVTSRAGWGWKGPDVGETIAVAYPATRPMEAEIIGLGLFMNALIFSLFAFPLLLLGLGSLRACLRRARGSRTPSR